ncbi:hypothetical protein SDRG_11759 [Saprolegnia diclina VS20]|uniref:RRM domain-containing protein n=1 Tax=Saprolegnia diclina (strain VS20) TaxID=1156394 RepID=T0QAC0_SAPDV|nr:hypothetical protein SDRG_11759 [Saprolegnia diclina VS20]EQC30440.1 hypothetical protein SDRG_11759 [Saprolegnia diclina VS20]|eukprot:XP_008616033.1 hypothetical protein SDRG_11759 [Saprolegnia diclina VS20]
MVQRLYVGRLPEDVTKAELVSRFERLLANNADLRIDDVQLMANSAAKDFAYLQIASASGDAAAETATVDAFVKAYHNTKWKGKRLRVESAKPDFLQRLQAAWTDDEVVKAEVLAERERAFAPAQSDEAPAMELKKSKRYKGKRMLFGDDGVVTIVASKAPVVAAVVAEAPQSDREAADEDDGHLSSETSDDDDKSDDEVASADAIDATNDDDVAMEAEVEAPVADAELSSETSDEDIDAPEDGAMSSETSDDEAEEEGDEQEDADAPVDDVADEDEASPADDIDMEAEIERELELAYAQAQAASSSSSDSDSNSEDSDSNSEDNDEDVDMEAEIAKELEAPVEVTPAAPVVDEAARKEAANARRLAAIKEREAQMAAKKKQPTPIAATNKKITFGDDSDDSDVETTSTPAPAPSKKRGFLSDSDDDDDDDDKDDDDFLGLKRRKTEALFEFRPEFAGADGKRLFEMQKRFGGDQRFRLDARFVEGDEFNDGVDDATHDVDEPVNDAVQAWATVAPDADEVAKQTYIAETERALDVLSLVFPNMELERAKARLHRSVSDAKDLKQLGWLASVRRYDPRDADAKAFEQTAPTDAEIAKDNDDDDDDGEVLPPMPVRKETPMPEVSEERYFAATSDLSTMFSRVRANSEDGEEMEAALDGIVKPTAAASTGFSFASMFGGGDVIEDDDDHVDAKPLEEKPDLDESTWHFANTVRKVVQDDSTDDEAMEEDDEAEDEPATATDALPKRQVADVLAFGASFCKPDPWTKTHEADWMTLRKTYTLDFRRKHKQALKNKKTMKKQFQKPRHKTTTA